MIRPNGRLSTFMLSLLIVLILGCSDDGATAGEAAPTDSAMKALRLLEEMAGISASEAAPGASAGPSLTKASPAG